MNLARSNYNQGIEPSMKSVEIIDCNNHISLGPTYHDIYISAYFLINLVKQKILLKRLINYNCSFAQNCF